jgi:SAM-dependent methyltransferase
MTGDKPWHETEEFWSDTEFLLFGERRIAIAVEDIDNLVSLLNLTPEMSVLDLCCGVGRHSLEFARRGYRVTGVDRTERYLERAKAIAKEEGLDVEFVCQDMREFRRPEAFDVAINMFTSFGYFDDPLEDRRVAENLFASLKPGGGLVMEMMGKEVIARIFQERDWHEMDDGTIVLEERSVTRGWSWMENRWIILRNDQRLEQHFCHRPYSSAELTSLLLDCGFESAQAFGGVDGSPYDHTAKRMTVVARK